MVDWNSTEEITRDAQVFNNLVHTVIGLYLWEWASTLWFDWEIYTRKRTFRWPMIFYLLNRYTMVGTAIGMLISQNSKDPTMNCTALYTYIQFVGDASVALPSLNLSIRTMAVWSDNKFVKYGLILVILGHWAILFQGLSVTAIGVPGSGCTIAKTNLKISIVLFIYTMSFDFVTMLLNLVKLARPAAGHSSLTRLLFTDGLVYFFIAFVFNTIGTVFMVLSLNPVMSIIFVVPAAVGSTIVAGRAFRRLSNFGQQAVSVYSASGSHAIGSASGGQPNPVPRPSPRGVQIRMETFTVADDQSAGQSELDIEAQSAEYKRKSME